MKRILMIAALMTSSLLLLSIPANSAGSKHTPEQKAALKKCSADYSLANKEAKSKKGSERKMAMDSASKSKKECMASVAK